MNTTSLPGYSRGPAQSLGGPAMGHTQVVSKQVNSPRAHFGTSTREHGHIVYSCFTYKPQ